MILTSPEEVGEQLCGDKGWTGGLWIIIDMDDIPPRGIGRRDMNRQGM